MFNMYICNIFLIGNKKPKFNESCKSFELDSCGGFAKVCLVYKDIKISGK